MKIIFKNAKIIDSKSSFSNQVVDIFVENGFIKNIDKFIENTTSIKEVNLNNLHISQGWIDTSVCFGEPGFEDRETIANGLNTAAKSGFSGVCLQPNTYPILDNQSQISFVKNISQRHATNLYPIGALTKNSEGIDLSELLDMKNAGAIAFGDYDKSIENANLLKIALQYTQDFDGLVISFCEDKKIKGKGIVNEGENAIQLGLKGIPNLAEEIDISRNLSVLEYTGGKLHIPKISSAKSVYLIKEAKNKGLNVTCSVSVHHLVLTDDNLFGFDTNFKTSPPLRTKFDCKQLIESVLNGVIDIITSDHNPIDIENKKLEFDLSKNGTIGLESSFGALLTILPLDVVIDKLTVAKDIFCLDKNEIEIGCKADFSLFNPDEKWIFKHENILSKSKNSAFLDIKMLGKAYGIFNNNQLILG